MGEDPVYAGTNSPSPGMSRRSSGFILTTVDVPAATRTAGSVSPLLSRSVDGRAGEVPDQLEPRAVTRVGHAADGAKAILDRRGSAR
jgi:hypothetical protein